MGYDAVFYRAMAGLFGMWLSLPWRQSLAGIGGFARYFEYPLAVSHLMPLSGRLLDVGCGSSIFPAYVARLGPHVTLLDRDARALLLARERIDRVRRHYRIPDRLSLHVGDATRMSLADDHFDFVTCISMIEHPKSNGDTSTIREIARVLRPGGKAFVSFPYGHCFAINYYATRRPWRETDGQDKIERRYDQPSVERRLIVPSGLRVVRQGYALGGVLNRITAQINHIEWLLAQRPAVRKARNLKGAPLFFLAQVCARLDRANADNAEFTYLVLEKPED